MLQLDHERDHEAEVGAGQDVVHGRAVGDPALDVDDPDPVILGLVGLGPTHDLGQLVHGRHLEAEVIERRGDEVGIAGEQVDELGERAGVQDQRVARLAGVVGLGPAEDLPVEIEDVLPALVVEDGAVHADGHVVEAGSKLEIGHGDTSGRTRTFPAISPFASAAMAADRPARVTSSGSISRSIGIDPLASNVMAWENPSAS